MLKMSIALIQFKCIKHCILFYLNYFVFQLVLQKEPSVLIVIIFHRIHKKVVHLIKLIVLENDNVFSLLPEDCRF